MNWWLLWKIRLNSLFNKSDRTMKTVVIKKIAQGIVIKYAQRFKKIAYVDVFFNPRIYKVQKLSDTESNLKLKGPKGSESSFYLFYCPEDNGLFHRFPSFGGAVNITKTVLCRRDGKSIK